MLRITREDGTGGHTTLRLEGCVTAEWADLVERECATLRRSGFALSLDLTGVGLVDRAGIETIARLGHAGVGIVMPAGTVASVLEAEGVHVTTILSR